MITMVAQSILDYRVQTFMARNDSDEILDVDFIPDDASDDLGEEILPRKTVSNRFWVLLVSGIVLAGVGIYLNSEFPENPVFSTVSFALAGACIICATMFGSGTLQVHERGLVWKRRSMKPTIIRYVDVDRIYLPSAIAAGGENVLLRSKIFTSTGASLYIGQFPVSHSIHIAAILVGTTIKNLAAQMFAEMEADAVIPFGKIRASRQGIQFKKSPVVAWEEVSEYNFSPGGFRIFVRNRPMATMQMPINTMNLTVLMFLIDIMPKMLTNSQGERESLLPSSTRRRNNLTHGGIRTNIDASESTNTVAHYPEHDPKLGTIRCGLPKSKAFITTLIVGAVMFVAGVLIIIAFPPVFGPNVFGILLACIGPLVMLISPLMINPGIAVYDHGLVRGKKQLRWVDAERIYYAITDNYHNGAYVGRTTDLKIQGEEISIKLAGTSLPIESMCQEILNQATLVMVPAALERIDSGGTLNVGSVRVTAEGIANSKKRLAFKRIGYTDMTAGTLSIFEKDEKKATFQITTNEWNFPIFMGVLSAVIGAQAQAEQGNEADE